MLWLLCKGNHRVWTKDFDNCPASVKFKTKTKLLKEVLVHCPISEKGIAILLFNPADNSVNKEMYVRILKFNLVIYIK